VRHLRAWLILWVALFLAWLLFSGDANRIEVSAGACAAAVAATICEIARTKAGIRAAVPLRLVGPVFRALVQVVPDFGYLVWGLVVSAVRREVVRGETKRRAFHAVGEDARSVGERAVALWSANFSPNAIAIDIDREHEQSIVHDLIVNRASERPA
jgi:multisubunit Na+/H+ antiporter MnhE subunit